MPGVLFAMSMPSVDGSQRILQATGITVLLLFFLLAAAAIADDSSPGLGRVPSPAELASLESHVFADGEGLPPGSGDGEQGKSIYSSRCAACHGNAGQGGSAMELVGDRSLLATEFPDRGIAVYWPYAPTLFEYIKRAMPPDQPYSLSDDEVYAVIARLLEMNKLIPAGQTVDAAVLSTLKMPNRDGFRSVYTAAD